MRKMVRKSVAILIGLALTATGLWAAGAEEETPAAAADKKYVTDPVTGKVYTAPEYGGTLTTVRQSDGAAVDPYVFIGAHSMVSQIVVEKLGMLDWALDREAYHFSGGYLTPEWAMTGGLAESWEQPDDTTFVFNIRQGVHWHDKPPMNGRELTAEDVEHSFQRYLGLWDFADAGPGVYTGDFGALAWESIEATGRYTLEMKLKEPNIRAMGLILDWYHNMVYPPEVLAEHGDISDWTNLVGTGPYELTDWVKGSSLEFTRNPNYWGFDPKYPEHRLPYVEKIEALIIPEAATRLAGLRAGTIDYLGHAGSTQLFEINQALSLQRTNPELNMYPWSQRSDNAAAMNVTRPPFDDIRVRHALQMALDLETMNDSYFKGFGDTIPRGIVGRRFPGFATPYEEWSGELKGYFAYDPDGAEKLLDEAGYPRGADGIRFKTTYLHFDRFAVSWTELMAAFWREIGIEVDIQTPARPEFNARRNAGDWDMISTSTGIEADPMWQIGIFYSKGPHGRTVVDAQFDAWYETALATTDIEEQKRLINQMDMHAIEQHWDIWGPSAPQYNVVQPWVMGYDGEGVLGGGTNYHIFKYLWIDSELKAAMGH